MSNRLEKYLREVAVKLYELPTEEREEQIEEIRVHIEACVDQHKSGGKTDAEAERDALLQFGNAAKVGREIMKARTYRNLRAIGLPVLIMLAIATAVSCLSFRDMYSPVYSGSATSHTALLVSLQVAEAFFIGTCAGLILRRLAVKWIVWYYAITIIPSLAGIFIRLHRAHVALFADFADICIQIIISLVGVAVAFAGAWIGARLASRLIGKVRPVAIR